ncbi:MAG: hypothetical protein PHE28_00520 [Bacteroidales bacterium]|nr:hypothetical protein [Bacteroidales bacterium]
MKLNKIILGILLLSTSFLNAQENTLSDSKKNLHFFSLDIGYSYRLSSKPNELFVNQNVFPDHYSSLRHGLKIGFSYDYLIKPNLAVGFKTNAFNSAQTTFSPTDSIDVKDDEYMFYVGPSVKYLFPTFGDKWNLSLRATAGYLSFRNSSQIPMLSLSGTITPASLTYKGNNFGSGLDLDLDYSINSFSAIGLNGGYFGGQISTLKLGEDKFELNQKENLSRLDFTIGFTIKL